MDNQIIGVLAGIRVADFCQQVVGASTSGYLADFGAEVIKIESQAKVDGLRLLEPFKDRKPDVEGSACFARTNQNKLSVLINLKKPKGIELAKKLVSISDVVTENFSVGVIERLGLGYDQLKQVKPDLIYCRIAFAGSSGPYSKMRGMGGLSQAMGGLNELTGYPEGLPCAPEGAYTDNYCPPLWAAAIIAALEHRRKTGKGQFIDCSIFEAAVECIGLAILDYSANNRIQTRHGNYSPNAAPHGVYRCKGRDSWCAIAVSTQDEWHAFCDVLGNPRWTRDEKFSSLAGRLANVSEVDEKINEWTREYSADEVMRMMQEAGVPAGRVSAPLEMYDPQLRHRNHFWQAKEPELEPFVYEAPAARLSKGGASLWRPQPHMGENNEYVFLQLLDLSDEEYAQYVGEEIIY
jgi:benzylsuccinate CoA-transferase BbsF subunit